MKALTCDYVGNIPSLTIKDTPVPKVAPGQVRIRVKAAGLNYADLMRIDGTPPFTTGESFIPGFEASGMVSAVGEGVSRYKIGDRVAAFAYFTLGAFAEEMTAQSSFVMPLPETMSFIDGAGIMVAYGTVYYGLARRAQLRAGETLVVHGATSSTGLAAVQTGKALGGRVIAIGRDDEKLRLATEAGADMVININQHSPGNAIMAATGGHGADAIFDLVGGDILGNCFSYLRKGGRVVCIGSASVIETKIPLVPAMVANCDMHFISLYNFAEMHHADMQEDFVLFSKWLAEGKITNPVTHLCSLVDAPDVIGKFRERAIIGKIVIVP